MYIYMYIMIIILIIYVYIHTRIHTHTRTHTHAHTQEAHKTQLTYPEDAEVCSNRIKLTAAPQTTQYSCALYWAVQTMTTAGTNSQKKKSTV
jgi:hypothetical protein